jgi:hypothetical protein
MTADRASWVGTVTVPELLSPLEVQRRVAQAIRRATYSWTPSWMLPMLPIEQRNLLVVHLLGKFYSPFVVKRSFVGFDFGASLLRQLKCTHLVPAKAPLPEEAIFNWNQATAEKRRDARKAQHKKRQIAKRDRNDNRNKR